MSVAASSNQLFTTATMPARWLGRLRSDLRDCNAADAGRFRGSSSGLFAVLAVLAVAYPVIASIAHAFGPSTPGGDSLILAISPFFDIVYAESLLFMLAAVGIGLFSPALGVLFMVVFIPADLLAAASSGELSTMYWQPPFGAILARVISYGLLWILAVEIPICTRRWAIAWAIRDGHGFSVRDVAVARVLGTGLLVFLWASALPWLIQPIFTWSIIQVPTLWASSPTWSYWPILVLGASGLAGVATIWPRSSGDRVAAGLMLAEPGPPRSTRQILIRQTVAALLIALLLGGLMTTVAEAVVLIVGLLIAGPLLTLLLPRIPVPAALARARTPVRLVAAMVIALGICGLILTLAGDALFATDYIVLVIALVVVAPIFRIILEAGGARMEGDSLPSQRRRPPPAATTAGLLLLGAVVWLGLPTVALADDCSDASADEANDCPGGGIGSALALAGGALAAIGAGAAAAGRRSPPTPPPKRYYGPDGIPGTMDDLAGWVGPGQQLYPPELPPRPEITPSDPVAELLRQPRPKTDFWSVIKSFFGR